MKPGDRVATVRSGRTGTVECLERGWVIVRVDDETAGWSGLLAYQESDLTPLLSR